MYIGIKYTVQKYWTFLGQFVRLLLKLVKGYSPSIFFPIPQVYFMDTCSALY